LQGIVAIWLELSVIFLERDFQKIKCG
jgi:hypothetical protein